MKIRESVDTLLTIFLGPKKEDIERIYTVRGYHKPKPSPSETIIISGFSKKDKDGKWIPGEPIEQPIFTRKDPLDVAKFFAKSWERKPKDFYTILEKWPNGEIRERRYSPMKRNHTRREKHSPFLLVLLILLVLLGKITVTLYQDFSTHREKKVSETAIVDLQNHLVQRTKTMKDGPKNPKRLILSEDQIKKYEIKDPIKTARVLVGVPSIKGHLR